MVVVQLLEAALRRTVSGEVRFDAWAKAAYASDASNYRQVPMIAGLAWFSRGWTSPRNRNRYSDLMVYTFAAAGLLYLVQFVTKGTF